MFDGNKIAGSPVDGLVHHSETATYSRMSPDTSSRCCGGCAILPSSSSIS